MNIFLFTHAVCGRLTIALLWGLVWVNVARCQVVSPFYMNDVTLQSGLDFVHCDGSSGRHYLYESVASGMASFDYDLDGRIDVYFLNGKDFEGATADRPTVNRLYRNQGAFRFVDVTEASGLGDPEFGLGVCVGDYNNDGFPDVYLSNYGPNRLYINNGDGTFHRLKTNRASPAETKSVEDVVCSI